MNGWPEFGWPWRDWWPQVQDWATQGPNTPIDPWGLARQAGYWGGRAGLSALDWMAPAWEPMNEWMYAPGRPWYDSPWTQSW